MLPIFFFLLLLSPINGEQDRKRIELYQQRFLKKQPTEVVNYLTPIPLTEKRSGLETIDCIYLINLERRPKKWELMKRRFHQHNLKINRVNAINGWLLTNEDRAKLSGDYQVRLTQGQIGCLLSHVSVLKDAFERGYNRIWICEDDVKFVGDIQKLPALLNELTQLDSDWDIFYTDERHILKNIIDLRPDQRGKKTYTNNRIINDEITTVGLRFGMYSLIVSKKGIAKILHYFTHVYLWSPLDWDIHYIEGIREYSSRSDFVTVDLDIPISDTSKRPESSL